MKKRTRLTDEKLKELAMDMLAGRFYSDRDVPKGLMHFVFLPLALMDRKALKKLEAEKPALVYAVLGKDKDCGGRAINGFPIFMSCGFLGKEDVDRLSAIYDKLKQAIAAV